MSLIGRVPEAIHMVVKLESQVDVGTSGLTFK